MKASIRFCCPHCDELHKDHFDAETCCRPAIEEVWLCTECQDEFDAEDEAEACCGGDAILTPRGWQKHVQTLESAGQLRLVE
jgi:hypothetical protein